MTFFYPNMCRLILNQESVASVIARLSAIGKLPGLAHPSIQARMLEISTLFKDLDLGYCHIANLVL